MSTEKLVTEIVNDLIAVDSEFAGMGEDLQKLVKKLIEARPDAILDENFKKQLRSELRIKAQELKGETTEDSESSPEQISNLFKMQKLIYSLAGAALAVIVFFSYQQYGSEIFLMKGLDFETGIEKVESQAFGSLAQDVPAEAAFGRGGGGGGGGGAPEMMDMSMPAPEYTVDKFIYKGDISLPVGGINVLRRVKDAVSTGNLVRSLTKLDFDLADLGVFQEAKLQNFNIVEDKDFGYMASVDLRESNISLSQNYQRWPDPYRDCSYESEPDCYDSLRLGESDMLTDSEVLRVAAEFVNQFGINLANYGEPKIAYSWKEELARMEAEEDFYFPESVSVTYPLLIEGMPVYNQGGGEEGLNVTVDQRNKKVSGIWGLNTQLYQSSEYEAVSDEALFRRFLEKGGLWGWIPPEDAEVKINEIILGEPEEVLMKHWKYEDGENEELIIPALRFPVLETAEDRYFYQEAVVIPLAAEILVEREAEPPFIGIPEPMPLETEVPEEELPVPEAEAAAELNEEVEDETE
ncbi:MAG: hypothetical protein ABIH35_03960 [Patescibacteria group bacterium]